MQSRVSGDWILLRGLGREAEHWGDFPKRLAHAFPGSAIRCLDLPGTGKFYRDTAPTTIPEMVSFLREQVREELGAGRPTYLCAISLGGMVAAEWLRQAPGDFRAAVWINTSLRGMSPFYRRLSPGAWLTLFRALRERNGETRERLILRMVTNDSARLDPFCARFARALEQRPIRRETALRQLLAAARYRAPQTPPSVPVLLLNSLGDRLAHPSCSATIARKWNLPLETHATAGHDLPLEDPEWVIDRIVHWLEHLD